MSRLATAVIIAFLISASIVVAEEKREHWRGGDILYDGTTYYMVYGWGYNTDGGYVHGVQKYNKDGVLMEKDVVIRADVGPGEKVIQIISGPSAQPPATEEQAAPVPEEEKKDAIGALTGAAKETTAQAEARAKEPEGPQLTKYPGVEGEFYEATIINDNRLKIYKTYAVLDRQGNAHYVALQQDGKYKEVTLNIKPEDRDYFNQEYGTKIDDAKSKAPWLPQFIGGTVSFYQQYSGLAAWSSLIFDEEFLQKWKDTVNKIMCDWTGGVLGGKECWTSKICTMYSDIEPSRDGILYTAPIGGVPEAVAHIEGQRSLPFITPNETMWVYTVTFGLSNPSEKEGMTYNIVFNGLTKSASWWPEPQYLPEGGSVSAIGAAALMKLSANDYSEVCIVFDPGIETFDGRRKDRICNPIVQYAGGATAPYGMTDNTTLSAPGTQPAEAPGASV